MKDETMVIKLTEKGKKLSKQIEDAVEEWLKASDMTKEELLKYKNVKGFHIAEEEEGYYLAYYENGEKKQIGCGMYKEQHNEAQWIFGYICALLDNGNNYKSTFSKEFIKWGAKNEKR